MAHKWNLLLILLLIVFVVFREIQSENQIKTISNDLNQLNESLQAVEQYVDAEKRRPQTPLMLSNVPEAIDYDRINEAIEYVVRKEIGRQTASSTQSIREAKLNPEIPPDEALVASEKIIEAAITAGKWTAEINADLLKYAPSLDYEQKIQILELYHAAVNRGDLDVSGAVGSPF